MKIAVFTGSDLRNYGGGEKDVINWVTRLNNELDITVYTLNDTNITQHRIKKEDLPSNMKIIWYKGKKNTLLKTIILQEKIDLSEYDKVYSMGQGFLLNRKLIHQSKKFLLGIHTPSTLMTHPIQSGKLWKRIFFKILYPINMYYIKKADEIRVQNKDDERRLHEIGFKGKIWNVPPCMFDSTPDPVKPKEFYVIWVNRVSPEKRPEKLVELSIMLPHITFHAIGSGPMDYLFNDRPNIKKMGFLSEQKLSQELQNASVCVLTSRGENFGMSAIEAQAYGVPTLAYDVMGLRDYNEVKEDSNQICLRILNYYHEFLKDKQKYMDKRNKLREITLNKFSNKVIIPKIKEMITE